MQRFLLYYVGGSREVCRGLAMCFCLHLLYKACSLLSLPPSLPHLFWVSIHSTHQFWCCVDRCLEVLCGSVAMVISLLLRGLLPPSLLPLRHLPSNSSIGLEFNIKINRVRRSRRSLRGLLPNILNKSNVRIKGVLSRNIYYKTTVA